jgi:signal transduction histidine kinase
MLAALAGLVVIGGGVAIEALVRAPQAPLRAVTMARDVGAAADRERAVEAMALDRGAFGSSLRGEATVARSQVETAVRGIETIGDTGAIGSLGLDATLAGYRDALNQVYASMRAGRFDRARQLDRSRVTRYAAKLQASMRSAGASSEATAASASRIADVGAPLILLVIVLAGSFLFIRAVGERSASIRVAADRAGRERAEQVRRELLARTVQAAEDERSRLAAELHDGPVQRLTAVDYLLQRMRSRLAKNQPDDAAAISEKAQSTIREEIASLRRIMTDLRPPVLDQRGLVEALREYAGRLGPSAGIECTVDARLQDRLAPASETVLYRVAQEALLNVSKHSKARSAKVSLRQSDGWVRLEVADDGVGYESPTGPDPDGRHFGLMGIRERVEMVGGRWDVFSRPGQGTRVAAVLPRDPVR